MKPNRPPSTPMEGDQTLLPLDSAPPSRLPRVARKAEEEPIRRASAPPAGGAAKVGFWGKLCKGLHMEVVSPTVGLLTLAGCLTFLVAPEEAPMDVHVAAALSPSVLPTVVIDPGHGGRDEGARGYGLVEKDVALDLASRVEQQLQVFGFKTVMTRRNDTYVSLPERAMMANQVEFSVFVSLHCNNSPSSTAAGIETYFATEKVAPEPEWSFVGFFAKPEPMASSDRGENMAGYVQASLLNRTEAGNRGIKARPLYVVRHTRAPAVLVEAGFLSNPFEARMLATAEYRERLAGAIAEGVAQFARTMPPPPKPATQLAKAAP